MSDESNETTESPEQVVAALMPWEEMLPSIHALADGQTSLSGERAREVFGEVFREEHVWRRYLTPNPEPLFDEPALYTVAEWIRPSFQSMLGEFGADVVIKRLAAVRLAVESSPDGIVGHPAVAALADLGPGRAASLHSKLKAGDTGPDRRASRYKRELREPIFQAFFSDMEGDWRQRLDNVQALKTVQGWRRSSFFDLSDYPTGRYRERPTSGITLLHRAMRDYLRDTPTPRPGYIGAAIRDFA
jgi:hypothetical protein